MKARCPNCKLKFDAKRSARGAAYARDWDYLPDTNMHLLKWWLHNYRHEPINKKRIVSKYRFVTIDSVNARVSELYGCRLIDRTLNNENYVLNIERVEEVIAKDGKLK